MLNETEIYIHVDTVITTTTICLPSSFALHPKSIGIIKRFFSLVT